MGLQLLVAQLGAIVIVGFPLCSVRCVWRLQAPTKDSQAAASASASDRRMELIAGRRVRVEQQAGKLVCAEQSQPAPTRSHNRWARLAGDQVAGIRRTDRGLGDQCAGSSWIS